MRDWRVDGFGGVRFWWGVRFWDVRLWWGLEAFGGGVVAGDWGRVEEEGEEEGRCWLGMGAFGGEVRADD